MSRARALSDLVFDAIDGGVRRVEEMHGAIARRPFAAVASTGLPAAQVRGVHDGVSALVYESIRAAAALAGTIARGALALLGDPRRELEQEWIDHATLVRVASASGRPEWRQERRSIGATSHLRLLNDPAVYTQVRDRLGGG